MTDLPETLPKHAGTFTVEARDEAGKATMYRCACSCSAFNVTGPDFDVLDENWYAHMTGVRRAEGWTEQQIDDARPIEHSMPRQPSPMSGRWAEYDAHGDSTGGVIYPAEMATYLEHGVDGVHFTAVGVDRVDLWEDGERGGHYELLA